MIRVFASHLERGEYTGWWIGLIIGFAIVVVVVIVVAAILTFASRIADQAREATAAVDEARQTTAALWDVQRMNQSANTLLETARGAAQALRER